MNFDFELLLSVLVLASGFVWLLDIVLSKFIFKKSSLNDNDLKPSGSSINERGLIIKAYDNIVEFGKFLFPVVFVVLVLRSFVAEPFKIPSGSMLPTLTIGDYILVNKFSYGVRLPVLHTKIIELNEPKRGEIFVFRYPKEPSLNYIKRVIGLPGDKIEYYDKILYINGKSIPQTYQDSYRVDDIGIAQRLTEQLGGIEHDMLHMQHNPARNNKWVVPEGHYFAMGDNRDNSNDSRFWGFVPEENLVGKAFFIFFHWGELQRIGSII
ncbi:Signal peptidase I [hydrothermal vent metagenome]|uniref:Signal peptidase I n=1 Tax=hydrothermal vent metagenome TaxID=652676 RepID=A0A3B0ZJ94_9ZZZZ